MKTALLTKMVENAFITKDYTIRITNITNGFYFIDNEQTKVSCFGTTKLYLTTHSPAHIFTTTAAFTQREHLHWIWLPVVLICFAAVVTFSFFLFNRYAYSIFVFTNKRKSHQKINDVQYMHYSLLSRIEIGNVAYV